MNSEYPDFKLFVATPLGAEKANGVMFNLNWKDVCHYGSAIILMLVGGAGEVGIPLPGVTVSDPKTVLLSGVGILVAGLKGGWTSGGK